MTQTIIPAEIKQLNFEDAFTQLEATVQKLEAGNLPLADALELYRLGTILAQHCNSQLDSAELTIKQLTPAGDLLDFDEI